MKSKSFATVMSVIVMSISPLVFAQSDAPKSTAPSDASKSAAPSDAQKSFDTMKTFAGEWEGPVNVPEVPEMNDGKPLHISLRVTSRGNALVHEMQAANTPLDASKYDHPVTMLYVEGGQLNLIHYCDAGNRPHMVGKMSPDGKTVEFGLVDVSGGNEHGHMHHAVFTYIDATHHTEDWTYMMGDKPVHAHFDLHKSN